MLVHLKGSIVRAATLGIAAAIVSAAHADDVHFVGSTLGRFNGGAFGATDSLLDLTYSNSTFDNTSVGGLLDLGGDPTPGANFNNLGSFSLGMANETYDGNSFAVQITFTAPFTIAGGNSTIFTDQLIGTVSNGNGGVFIDFDNTPRTFTFSNGTTSGSFTMAVNDVSIAPGHDASITAHLSASQVPEPVSLAGMACGAFGLISARRRRRSVV